MPRPAALLLLVLAALLVAAGPASADDLSPRVGGGTVLGQDAAPFAVRLVSGNELCSGSVLDADTILTAAHCTYDGARPLAGDAITVQAGYMLTQADADRTPKFAQNATSTSILRHPHYVQGAGDGAAPADVALLTVTPPLKLSAAMHTAAIARIATGTPRPGGATTLYGFGTQIGAPVGDNTLRSLELTQEPTENCGTDNAVAICGRNASGAGCPGDSGGPTTGVLPSGTTVLVGVNRSSELPCHAGGLAWSSDLASPEVGLWIDNPKLTDAQIPRAPVYQSGGTISARYGLVSCGAGTWANGPSFSYTFVDATTRAVLRPAGPDPVYHGAQGQVVGCLISASSAGGTSMQYAALNGPLVKLTPRLAFALRGRGYRYVAPDFPQGAPLTLQYRASAGGPVVAEVPFTNGRTPKRPRLAPGRYQACIHTAGDDTYNPADACATDRVDGPASRLVSYGSAARTGSRWSVTLSVTGPLVGKRVTATWSVQRSRHGRTTRTVKRIRLTAATTLTAPRAKARAGVKLRLSLPAFKRDGVRYGKSTYEKTLHKAR